VRIDGTGLPSSRFPQTGFSDMSLFENPAYQWRETFFVFLDRSQRPQTQALCDALAALSGRFRPAEAQSDEVGQLESITVFAPDDLAAMDITAVNEEEVEEQLPELVEELAKSVTTSEERDQLKRLKNCSARLDVYHFGQRVAGDDEEDEDEMVDPAGVLALLEQLAKICDGIVVDPQTGVFVC
jgi:hypothetical protein